jgi:ABC-2 type transport system permease protein
MAALAILRRDLLRFARNPVRTALLFSVPVVMAGIFALVFGGGGGNPSISIRVLLLDEDEGLLSAFLSGAANQSGDDASIDIVPVGPEGYEMMERGEATALLHIPENFTTDYIQGTSTTLRLVTNPAQQFLPMVVDEGVGLGGEVLSEVSHVFRPELDQLSTFVTQDGFPADAAVAALSVGINSQMRSVQKWLLPPVIELETSTVRSDADEAAKDLPILAFFLPGLATMGVLFLAQAATRDILRDREAGLLKHLLTAPLTPTDYLAGKCLSVLVVTTVGFLILIGVGVAAGVDWGPLPTTLALVLATSIGASGTLLLIMSLAGTERQADAISTIVIMLWSLLGGAFVPLSQMPSFLEPVAGATLVYWAVAGFNASIQQEATIAGVLVNLLVLSSVGIAFLAVGGALLRRRMARGVI